jgi:hypothetical protein
METTGRLAVRTARENIFLLCSNAAGNLQSPLQPSAPEWVPLPVSSVIRLNPAIRDRVKAAIARVAEDVIVLPCRRVALQGRQWRVDVQTL